MSNLRGSSLRHYKTVDKSHEGSFFDSPDGRQSERSIATSFVHHVLVYSLNA